jgi:sulfoxide reductase catalytic subunit YedY
LRNSITTNSGDGAIIIQQKPDIKPSEITPQSVYQNRRKFLKTTAALAIGGSLPLLSLGSKEAAAATKFENLIKSPFSTDAEQTDYEDVTSYNNFYEFGTDKRSPAREAHRLTTRPWSLSVSGECEAPKDWDIEDILKTFPAEERIYRHRCVEAWSMVVPWVGFSLGDFLKVHKPTSKAKYIEMLTLVNPDEMIGQRSGLFGSVLNWPYREGLRIDEAMNPLAIFAVGLYGEHMPNQNGAPIRLVTPWKYGFKGVKSIVSVKFTEEQPFNTWQEQAPNEYGFYANVNPNVDHPRWSQASERRVGTLFGRHPTLMFNGYEEQVAHLYSDIDLTVNF